MIPTPAPRLLASLSAATLALALTCTAVCAQDPVVNEAEVPVAKGGGPSPLAPVVPLNQDDYYSVNSSAHGLAGITAATDRGAVAWEATGSWKEYQAWLDERWTYLDRVRLSAMRTWSTSALSGIHGETGTVFYPFSGPDVLYADTLFPDSKILIMAGLEPVGTMPDLAKLQADGRLGPYLNQVQTSLVTILGASFFKTKDMKNDFNNNLVDGLVPAMAVFIARQGYTIDSLQYVTLGTDGIVHLRGVGSGSSGVQITYFKGDNREKPRTVLYFKTNLANDGLKSDPGYIRLMQRLAPGVTYLKAASYLLHEDYFSTMRNAILDDSLAVVEDDSGIPYADFKPDQWTVTPYGNYTGPIGLFKDKFQPDLMEYYAKTPHEQLTFGSGYKYVAAGSSLLVAEKKK